jgi:beta-lactamase class A
MTRLSRRQALFGGLTLAAVAASAPKTVLADPAEPLAGIDERIVAIERRHNAYVGLFAADLEDGRSISHRGQQAFAMCSTFKGYASARVLQMVEQGELSLEQEVFVDPAEIVANSPKTQPRAGGDMTLDELCQAALQVSDNTAGNLLLKTIGGPPAITAFARSIGDPSSRLDR